MTIKELAGRLDDFMNTLDVIKVKIVRDNEEALVDLNREQMLEGKTSKGEEIAPGYRSAVYERMKNRMNARPGLGVPDLHLTGDFHKAMQMDIDTRSYSFFSSDEKAADIDRKYKDIFGLTKENIEKAKGITTAGLIAEFRRATKL